MAEIACIMNRIVAIDVQLESLMKMASTMDETKEFNVSLSYDKKSEKKEPILDSDGSLITGEPSMYSGSGGLFSIMSMTNPYGNSKPQPTVKISMDAEYTLNVLEYTKNYLMNQRNQLLNQLKQYEKQNN